MVIFHSYVSLPEGKDCLSKPEESIPVEKLIMGYPKKRMTCIEMEHTKFIEFRQPRSGASLFICILCEIHGPEDSIQSCKCVISAVLECAFAFQIHSGESWLRIFVTCTMQIFISMVLSDNRVPHSMVHHHFLMASFWSWILYFHARMKMRTQRGAHIYGIEHDGANTRPSMMGFWARLFFSGTSFLWTFHEICMNISKEKKMMNIFKRPHFQKMMKRDGKWTWPSSILASNGPMSPRFHLKGSQRMPHPGLSGHPT